MKQQTKTTQEQYSALIVALLVNVIIFIMLIYPRVDFSTTSFQGWFTNAVASAQVVLMLLLTVAIQRDRKDEHN